MTKQVINLSGRFNIIIIVFQTRTNYGNQYENIFGYLCTVMQIMNAFILAMVKIFSRGERWSVPINKAKPS